MSKSPINFGMMSGVGGMMTSMLSNRYANMSDQDLRRQYDSYSRLGGGIMGGVGSFFGGQQQAMRAEIERRQSLGDFGMPQESQAAAAAENAGMQAAQVANTGGAISNVANSGLLAGGNPYADDPANSITAGMAVGDAPIATAGNFNPQTEFAASRIFGPQQYKRKPLINF
jgi:hypothetical protein